MSKELSPKRIETERLVLRVRTVADAEAIFDFVSRPEVSYPAGLLPVKTLEDEIYYLEHILPERSKKKQSSRGLWNCCQGDRYGHWFYRFQSSPRR